MEIKFAAGGPRGRGHVRARLGRSRRQTPTREFSPGRSTTAGEDLQPFEDLAS